MNQVELDSGDIKEFLQHIIQNNRFIQEKGMTPVSTEIIGDSGLGKTSIALQLAKELDMNYVKLNLAQIEELGDLIGFPMRQFQLIKGGNTKAKTISKIVVVDGKKVVQKIEVPAGSGAEEVMWADENAVDEYLKQGWQFTEQKRMSYCPPEWIADKKGGGFLILDDWNRADIRFIQAVMELVDRQEYISWKLPKDWHILLTANPDNGDYLVNTIDTAQKTRFVSIVLKWNHDRWAEWAERQEVDTRCINFVLMHPEIVNARVNPRSLTTFFNCISSIQDFENSLPLIQNLGEGSVGPETATLFTSFINNKMDKMVTPKEILLGEHTKPVMEKMKDVFGQGDDYRADIASIITTRLINYTLYYAEKNPIDTKIIDRLTTLIKEDGLFTDDLKYHVVKKIINGNKQKFQKMLIDTKVQELATK
jgi:hypothetical protein